MSYIKFFSLKFASRDVFFITIITIILLVLSNLIFVYFSPYLIPKLPSNFVRSISSCFRTFYHFDLNSVDPESAVEVIFGDSYSEGMGDEFLEGNDKYGIFKKLPLNHIDENYIIYGRSGYGNLSSMREAQLCEPLLNKFTSMSYINSNVKIVTFVFYEGNDLNNNLRELENLKRGDRKFAKTFSFFNPIFGYLIETVDDFVNELSLFKNETRKKEKTSDIGKTDLPLTLSGIRILEYPQAAALELTPAEFDSAVSVLKDVLIEIRDMYPSSKLQFLYLPSVASSYIFQGEFPVVNFKGKSPLITTGINSEERHIYFADRIRSLAELVGWDFCDASGGVRALTSIGIPVHGPNDWKHFNSDGYRSVAQSYLSCFESE